MDIIINKIQKGKYNTMEETTVKGLHEISLKDFFKPTDDKLYASELFYILEELPYDKNDRKIIQDKTGDIILEKSVVSGNGLDINKCEKQLLRYKNLLVFDNPLVFSLVIGDLPIYEYTPKNGNFVINDIGVIGKIIYLSNDELASPVQISARDQSNNHYFIEFKKYFLENESTCQLEDTEITFRYKDKIFEILANNECILRLTGISKTATYPYVLYVLDALPKRENCYNVFQCQRIERK